MRPGATSRSRFPVVMAQPPERKKSTEAARRRRTGRSLIVEEEARVEATDGFQSWRLAKKLEPDRYHSAGGRIAFDSRILIRRSDRTFIPIRSSRKVVDGSRSPPPPHRRSRATGACAGGEAARKTLPRRATVPGSRIRSGSKRTNSLDAVQREVHGLASPGYT
jgi:hypothetical protein